MNDLIEFYQKLNQSFHDRSVVDRPVTFLANNSTVSDLAYESICLVSYPFRIKESGGAISVRLKGKGISAGSLRRLCGGIDGCLDGYR